MRVSKRRQYFVERGLQLRFARFVLLFMLGCCVVTGLVVFYSTFTVLSEKLMGIYPQARLVEIFRRAYGAFFLAVLFLIPVIFFAAVVFSHRLAGPRPKIYQTLRDIGTGQYDVQLTLRENDELKELADIINAMAAQLKEKETKK